MPETIAFEIALPSRSTMAMGILAGSALSLPLPPKIDPKNEAMAIGTAKRQDDGAAIAEEQLQVFADERDECAAISPSESFR